MEKWLELLARYAVQSGGKETRALLKKQASDTPSHNC